MTENLLEISHLTHKFPIDRRESLTALDDVSFTLRRGEIFGLVGESGSGKSTLARCVMNVYRPTAGKILFNGIETTDPRAFRKNRAYLQSARQIIFQDSNSSLDPKWQAWQIIAEPMRLQHVTPKRGSYRAEAEFQMHYVGLDPLYLDKYPPELSGGQRQRLAIARALTMEPELLVADEPIAALDVSIQAQIVNLFRHLQQEHGFTFLFIAHDLSMVEFLCDRVGVLYHGRLVELATAKELYANPLHPYTQALLSAIPIPDPRRERNRVLPEFPDTFPTDGVWTEETPGAFRFEGRKPLKKALWKLLKSLVLFVLSLFLLSAAVFYVSRLGTGGPAGVLLWGPGGENVPGAAGLGRGPAGSGPAHFLPVCPLAGSGIERGLWHLL